VAGRPLVLRGFIEDDELRALLLGCRLDSSVAPWDDCTYTLSTILRPRAGVADAILVPILLPRIWKRAVVRADYPIAIGVEGFTAIVGIAIAVCEIQIIAVDSAVARTRREILEVLRLTQTIAASSGQRAILRTGRKALERNAHAVPAEPTVFRATGSGLVRGAEPIPADVMGDAVHRAARTVLYGCVAESISADP
jgi:hypothetical protein